MLNEGIYELEDIEDGILGETQNGNFYVELTLKLKDESERAKWKLFFSDTVLQKTKQTLSFVSLKKLVEVGFVGKSISDFANPDIKPIDLFVKVKETFGVKLENETFTKDDGEIITFLKTKWVSPRKKSIDFLDAKAKIKATSLDGTLMSIRGTTKVETDFSSPEETIPF